MNYFILFLIVLNFVLLTILIWYININSNLIYLPYNIYIKQSKVGGDLGRGVFANKIFNQGEIIEKAPYITDSNENFHGLIRDYIFNKNVDNKLSCVCFGYASIYNHSDTPNASWKIMDDYILITAIKEIQINDEILISYGSNYWSCRKNSNKS
jgi:hypothetical protein